MTMTAGDLTTEIETRRDRIRSLTEAEQSLERSLTSGRNAIASALAGGALPDPAGARESVRSNSEELEATKGAIELLTRERVTLETQLKKAQAREAIERANQSADEAEDAIDRVDQAVRDAARTIFALRAEANQKIGEANGADQTAKSLNGQNTTAIPRTNWHNRPGLSDLLQEIDSYVHHQDVRVA